MKLYTYWRSSAAYRVRIALNLKGVEYEDIPVHLVKGGGQHLGEKYGAINPQHLVPSLKDGDDKIFTQSLSVIEYLDEIYPDPALLPAKPEARAHVRSLAQQIACEIHPVNNLRVLKYLTDTFDVTPDQKTKWYRHWVAEGFEALEASLEKSNYTGTFCFGEKPGLADCCLIPQVYNAKRFDVPLEGCPVIRRITDACQKLPAFNKAAPENQSDAD